MHRHLACLAAFLLAAVPAAAQETVDWVVDVDENGFSPEAQQGYDFLVGDQVALTTYNLDGADHELVLDGTAYAWTAPGLDSPEGPDKEHPVFTFDEAGVFVLRDVPTGDTLEVRVGDVEDFDPDAASDAAGDDATDGGDEDDADEGAPALPIVLLLGALAAVAWLRRQ